MIAGQAYSALSLDGAEAPGSDGDEPALGAHRGRMTTISAASKTASIAPSVNALTPQLREVVILRFFESLTQDQIAQRIGVPQMQVSRLLARALAQLRDGLNDRGRPMRPPLFEADSQKGVTDPCAVATRSTAIGSESRPTIGMQAAQSFTGAKSRNRDVIVWLRVRGFRFPARGIFQ